MDLKYLNTFRVIVEEGGFSKAADRLGYTQSTITFQIGQLEQELSTSLFEKIGRRMVLTKAGEHLIPYVNEVLSSVDRLRNFEDDLAECQGDLRVGVGETLLCFHLPAILKEFHKKAPKARLFLRSMNCYDIRDELVAGSLDIGVFYNCVGGFGTSLTTYFFGTYSLALVASQKTKNNIAISLQPISRYLCRLSSMSRAVYSGSYLNSTSGRSPSCSTTRLSFGVFQQSKIL